MTSSVAANNWAWLRALLFATSLLLLGRSARADSVRESMSQTLFDDARKLMQERRFDDACPKLEESQRLVPTAGTLLNLALCHEQQGKTATAWLEYHEAVAFAARDRNVERRELARQRIAEIEPRLARLTVLVPTPVPAGLWILVDGVPLARSGWGSGLPVDPGVHRVELGAPGRIRRELVVAVAAGNERRLEVPSLAYAPVIPPVVARAPAAASTSRPGWAIVGGSGIGVAFAGVVATTYFGWRAQSAWNERNEGCRNGCSDAALDAGQDARDFAQMANVSALVALAGTLTGTYALWLRPKLTAGASTPMKLQGHASPDAGQLSLGGVF